jgi:1,2-diacylglycerol 3-alpha-glucosyltransferase
VPAYYAACDVFATASTFEVHPMTVLEALASGKPVAGADARGIPEFVTDGVTGHLFRPNDPVDAAEAIVRCLGRDDFRPACRDVAERFSLEKCTRQQVAAFQALRRDWDSGAIRHGTGRVFG